MKRSLAALAVVAGLATPAAALEQQYAVSLVEMPVAVARVAEVPTVEQILLNELLEELFDAELPPADFIDIVRYAPVMLVEDRDPELNLIELVRTREADGLAGLALAQALRQDLRTWGIPITPQVQLVEVRSDEFFPDIVVDRIGYDRLRYDSSHPHGGPPGQIKKELGLQTGAEVVHGEHPGNRGDSSVPVAVIDRERERRDGQRARDDDKRGNRGNANRGDQNRGNGGNAKRADDSPGNSGNANRGNNGNDRNVSRDNRGGGKPDNPGKGGNRGNSGKGKGGGR